METKKSICFIGNHKTTTQLIVKQLKYFLEEYVNINGWCLQDTEQMPLECNNCDIYVASSYTALNRVKKLLPKHKKTIIADRALDIKNLDKILELSSGTKVLVVANSEETTQTTIKLIEKIGVKHLDITPYYPGVNLSVSNDIKIAITTGSAHLIPPYINKIIDLGAKGLDLSTYVELILELNLPKELINNVSQYYIREIFDLTIRIQNVARINNNLKRRLEVIINTVDEAILAIDSEEKITLVNSALEDLLDINRFSAIGKKIQEVIPQINFNSIVKDKLPIINNIQQINNSFYVLNANPILNSQNFLEGIVATLKPVGELQKLETKVRRELNKHGNIAKYSFKDIIGHSPELKTVKRLAKQFAQTNLTVLIEGESGTGKELFAQAIHNASNRKKGPFVAINFAALPENLVESELFGYDEGAFTGAKKGGKSGLFEVAHQGTIFLDEIGDASLNVQKKLLRVLEEREVRRVGGRTVTPIDVRVIAATNQDLRKLVEENKFRIDLFYRLCTLPLNIPPLRERKEDILILIDYFSQKFYQRKIELDPQVKEFLLEYNWPGNIRELENIVQYMCSIVPKNEIVTINHLPLYLLKKLTPKNKLEPSLNFYNQKNYELIIQELKNLKLLTTSIFILKEIQNSTILNKGIGRGTLLKRLQNCRKENFKDHELKKILNLLTKVGLIEPGKTKQGTKITSLGNNFLEYVKKSPHLSSLSSEAINL